MWNVLRFVEKLDVKYNGGEKFRTACRLGPWLHWPASSLGYSVDGIYIELLSKAFTISPLIHTFTKNPESHTVCVTVIKGGGESMHPQETLVD